MQRARRRTRAAILVLAGTSLGLLLYTLWARGQYQDRVRLVTHTQEVISAIGELRVSITKAETIELTYLLTGDRASLTAFEAAVQRAEQQLEFLRARTSDNPSQRLRLDSLKPLLGSVITEMRRMIDLRSTGEARTVTAALQSYRGQRLMERVAEATGLLKDEEERLLAERRRARRRTDTLVNAALLAGFGTTIAALTWAMFAIRRYERQRDRAELQLQTLNKELELRVEERTANLQRSNQDLEQFAYAASHDLQEPLRMVSSYVDLLGKRYSGRLDEDADTYIRFAVDGAKRMQRLVNDLLAYSRAGTQALEIGPVDSGEVLQEVMEQLQNSIRDSGADITADALPRVQADRVKLASVLQNLLSNAIKFAKPGIRPQIRVSARLDRGMWQFTVRDEGIGFDSQYAEKVFQLFQRLHGGDGYPGTGIGLALCKRVIEGHGGRIWVESAPDQGSSFHFVLPAARR